MSILVSYSTETLAEYITSTLLSKRIYDLNYLRQSFKFFSNNLTLLQTPLKSISSEMISELANVDGNERLLKNELEGLVEALKLIKSEEVWNGFDNEDFRWLYIRHMEIFNPESSAFIIARVWCGEIVPAFQPPNSRVENHNSSGNINLGFAKELMDTALTWKKNLARNLQILKGGGVPDVFKVCIESLLKRLKVNVFPVLRRAMFMAEYSILDQRIVYNLFQIPDATNYNFSTDIPIFTEYIFSEYIINALFTLLFSDERRRGVLQSDLLALKQNLENVDESLYKEWMNSKVPEDDLWQVLFQTLISYKLSSSVKPEINCINSLWCPILKCLLSDASNFNVELEYRFNCITKVDFNQYIDIVVSKFAYMSEIYVYPALIVEVSGLRRPLISTSPALLYHDHKDFRRVVIGLYVALLERLAKFKRKVRKEDVEKLRVFGMFASATQAQFCCLSLRVVEDKHYFDFHCPSSWLVDLLHPETYVHVVDDQIDECDVDNSLNQNYNSPVEFGYKEGIVSINLQHHQEFLQVLVESKAETTLLNEEQLKLHSVFDVNYATLLRNLGKLAGFAQTIKEDCVVYENMLRDENYGYKEDGHVNIVIPQQTSRSSHSTNTPLKKHKADSTGPHATLPGREAFRICDVKGWTVLALMYSNAKTFVYKCIGNRGESIALVFKVPFNKGKEVEIYKILKDITAQILYYTRRGEWHVYAMPWFDEIPKNYPTESLVADCVEILKKLKVNNVHHCDIKPSSLKFDGKAQKVRVIDFDLSAISGDDLNDYNGGTDDFMAPETVKFRRHSFKSDVFSMGLTLKSIAGRKFDERIMGIVNAMCAQSESERLDIDAAFV